MILKYKVMKTKLGSETQEFTGLTYECKASENGDDAIAFAKHLELLFNDGCIYDVSLTG